MPVEKRMKTDPCADRVDANVPAQRGALAIMTHGRFADRGCCRVNCRELALRPDRYDFFFVLRSSRAHIGSVDSGETRCPSN